MQDAFEIGAWPLQHRRSFKDFAELIYHACAGISVTVALIIISRFAPSPFLTGVADSETGSVTKITTTWAYFVAVLFGLSLYFWGVLPVRRLHRYAPYRAAWTAHLIKLAKAVLPIALLLGLCLLIFSIGLQAIEIVVADRRIHYQTACVVLMVILLTTSAHLQHIASRRAHTAFNLSYKRNSPVQKFLRSLRP